MWFTVLGPVRARRDGTEIDLGAPQQQAVLAVLVARAGQPVSLAEIVDVLWWEDPPATAVNTVHRSVGMLRRALEPGLAARGVGRWLVRAGGGYRLDAGADTVDVLRFRELMGRARTAADPDLFAEALELWQGPVVGTLSPDVRGRPVFVALEREYEAAAGEAALLGDMPGRLLRAIEQAADRAPLNESLQARLMLLLAAAGQTNEARRRFAEVKARLADDLDVEPGPELTAAWDRILRPAPPEEPTRGPARLAQLPRRLPSFTGREAELAAALTLLDDDAAVPVGAISGMGGVGKTAFAVHLAHLVAARYPDGQLHLDLRGFGTGAAMDPAEALARLLEALDVPPQRIPAGIDARAALYRSHLAGRRMLVLLDNARDTAQVRPLLPGTPGCLVLVTSRDWLAGLIVSDGAQPIALEAFSAEESRRMLAARLGAARTGDDPAAVGEVVRHCAGLPLALAIVAARAATQPRLTMAALAAELAGEDLFGGRENGGENGDKAGDPDVDVRAVFASSYRVLGEAPARLFRLLGLHPGTDITVHAAAALADVEPREARPLLDELVRGGLLGEVAPGRYGTHDLLRAYAAGLVKAEEADALDRLLDHYLHTAYRAERLLAPGREPIRLADPVPGARPESPGGQEPALAWFGAEYRTLRAFVERLADSGASRSAWQLAWTLDTFLRRQGHRHEQVATGRIALAAAKRLGDPVMLADTYRNLGHALSWADRPDEARAHLAYALDRYAELGDVVRQAHVERGIAHSYLGSERYDEALRHCLRAEELYRAADHRSGLAKCLNESAFMHTRIGEFEQAQARAARALDAFRELGDRHGEAATLDTLGIARAGLGDHDRAVADFRAAAELCERLGDRRFQADVLVNLGDAFRRAGDGDAAAATWRSAVAIMEATGHPQLKAIRAKLANS